MADGMNPYSSPQATTATPPKRAIGRTKVSAIAGACAALAAAGLDAAGLYMFSRGLDTRNVVGFVVFLVHTLLTLPGLPLFLILDELRLIPRGEEDDYIRGIILLFCNSLTIGFLVFCVTRVWPLRRAV